MTVSSIAVGPAADAELLTNIAKWGKGRSYVGRGRQGSAADLRQGSEERHDAGVRRRSRSSRSSRRAAFLEGVDFAQAPRLRGRTATVLKDTALELLATEDGDPLLAFWPIGLGRTAVFASDVRIAGRATGCAGAATGRSSAPSCTRSSASGRRAALEITRRDRARRPPTLAVTRRSARRRRAATAIC